MNIYRGEEPVFSSILSLKNVDIGISSHLLSLECKKSSILKLS
jgi:hypothetical protein